MFNRFDFFPDDILLLIFSFLTLKTTPTLTNAESFSKFSSAIKALDESNLENAKLTKDLEMVQEGILLNNAESHENNKSAPKENISIKSLATVAQVDKKFNRLANHQELGLWAYKQEILTQNIDKLNEYINKHFFSLDVKKAISKLRVFIKAKVISADHTINSKPLIQLAVEKCELNFSYQMVIFLHSHGAKLDMKDKAGKNLLIQIAEELMPVDRIKKSFHIESMTKKMSLNNLHQSRALKKNMDFNEYKELTRAEMDKIIQFITLQLQQEEKMSNRSNRRPK